MDKKEEKSSASKAEGRKQCKTKKKAVSDCPPPIDVCQGSALDDNPCPKSEQEQNARPKPPRCPDDVDPCAAVPPSQAPKQSKPPGVQNNCNPESDKDDPCAS